MNSISSELLAELQSHISNDLPSWLEEVLGKREDQHHTLNQQRIIGSINQAGHYTYVNDRFCEISGYSHTELANQNWLILKPEVHSPESYRGMCLAIENGTIWQGEICNQRKDGSLYWLVCTLSPYTDSKSLSQQYVFICTDISQLKSVQSELYESKKRHQQCLSYANIGTWDWNIRTGELFWSERIPTLFGHAAGELETSYDNFIAAIHPDDRQAVIDAANDCLEHNIPYEIEHRVIWPDKTVHWLLERGGVNRDFHGKPLNMLGVVQDVTDRVNMEIAMVTARDKADRANAEKSRFLSSMSHELRTPMNSILGFAQIMSLKGTLSDEHKKFTQEILSAGRHLLELVNDVLDLAKVESGSIALNLEQVEVCPVVDECLSLVNHLAVKRNIQISHNGLKNISVRADRIRLRQVVLNLLSNAVKYNRKGGSVHLKVEHSGKGNQLRILVSDTGYGISEQNIKELFKPFNRLDAENCSIEGTGIGLTIVKRIVEMMSGKVGVESKVGTGSTFWIELPTTSIGEAIQSQAEETTLHDSIQHPIESSSTKHTVLYIEDNEANISLVKNILRQRKNITLHTALTPDLGIALARREHPSLILLDINMAGMDGYQVMETLKAEAKFQHIPFVAITANAMSKDIERGMAAGFSDYLTKPLDIPHFFKTVDRYLNSGPNNR